MFGLGLRLTPLTVPPGASDFHQAFVPLWPWLFLVACFLLLWARTLRYPPAKETETPLRLFLMIGVHDDVVAQLAVVSGTASTFQTVFPQSRRPFGLNRSSELGKRSEGFGGMGNFEDLRLQIDTKIEAGVTLITNRELQEWLRDFDDDIPIVLG